MSFKIASLFASIGADTSGFKKGANEVKTSMSSMAGSIAQGVFLGQGALNLLDFAMQTVRKTIIDSFKGYNDYVDVVRNTARALGTTTEEASRLIQVADDVTISTESMTTAFKLALKNGFTPTIDGLGAMSDAYLALAPGTERAQYLLDKFGRSGMEMGKLMDLGSAAIKRQSAAIEAGLIITQKAADQQRKYEIAVDSLSDSWKAFTYQVMPAAVDGLTAIMNQTRDSTRVMELAREAGVNLTYATVAQKDAFYATARAERETADANLATKRAANEAGGAFETEAEKAKILADGQKILQDALDATTAKNKDMLGLMQNITSENKNYAKSADELKTKHAELQADLDKLIKQGWWPYSEKVMDAKKALDDNATAAADLAAAHGEAFRKIAWDLLVAKLAAGGFTDAEFNLALQSGVTAGVIDQASADMAIQMNNAASAAAAMIDPLDTAAEAARRLAGDYVINIKTIYSNEGQANYGNGIPVEAGSVFHAHAQGGSFLIPQSYGNEGFRMGNGDTASAGERVTITPKEQTQSGDGIDYNRLARVIRDAIMQVSR